MYRQQSLLVLLSNGLLLLEGIRPPVEVYEKSKQDEIESSIEDHGSEAGALLAFCVLPPEGHGNRKTAWQKCTSFTHDPTVCVCR